LTMALFAAVWASTQQPSIPEPLAKIKAKYVGSKICFDCHIDVAKGVGSSPAQPMDA
jgi:hypothetical protein